MAALKANVFKEAGRPGSFNEMNVFCEKGKLSHSPEEIFVLGGKLENFLLYSTSGYMILSL